MIDGLTKLASRLGLSLHALLDSTTRLVHGTTVATNALLERKGARVGLLTTAGHRDILEMREGLKDERYNLRLPPPDPLVPRHLRLGVVERIRHDGTVATPLDEASLVHAINSLRAAEVDAVAVCFLHSYRNNEHEERAKAALQKLMPNVFVSISSEILPQIKEFERVSTTVVNAYVGPAVQRYFNSLETRLRENGYGRQLYIMLSHGGVAPVSEAGRLAAATVLSGPAGGIAGARQCAAISGKMDLIAFDMGGTSTDISVISDGQAALSSERGLAGQRIALRSLDIASIGAGGGSKAAVMPGPMLRVGPESAGADPGPACYGRGGTTATVTDANVVLGYLSEDGFLGGARSMDRDAAEVSIRSIATGLGMEAEQAASGIYRMINLTMAEGIRLMTVRRGLDPRRYALLSFGGAAGLHATEVARELHIKTVIIPSMASVLSAWGMIGTELRYEMSRTHIGDTERLSDAELRQLYAGLEAEGLAKTHDWFSERPLIRRSAEMRYGEQIYEIDVPLSDLDWNAPGLMTRVVEAFHRRHEELYTYGSRDQNVVLVNARVSFVGEGAQPSFVEGPACVSPPTPMGLRKISFRGNQTVSVFAAESLQPGHRIAGPAVIVSDTTSVTLHVGDIAVVDALGWLQIDVASP